MFGKALGAGIVGCLLAILFQPPAQAALTATLEGPADNQAVAGIGIIRGWAFSDTAGVQIQQVTLSIDGAEITAIPCCSVRADVASAFPQFPADNTRNSGYGITFNYGLLSEGPHTIEVGIRDSSGAQFNRTHNVTVVKPGGFEFIDQVDLTTASASRQGQELLVDGLTVRDKATQQQRIVNARLQWFQNTQALGMVAATTAGGAASADAPGLASKRIVTRAATEIANAALESPLDGDTAAGIAIIRGWAIAPAGRTIARVQLFIDGAPSITIPCCSRRGDIAAAFPEEPNAGNSGFGVTFNYGDLISGVHTLAVEIQDSAGALRTFTRGVVVRRPGEFFFLEQLDVGNSNVRIAGGQLVVENAVMQDRATAQTATRSLRYRWDVPSQAFVLAEESVADVTITSAECTINGDTSSLDNLKANSGPDGISLPELIVALGGIPIAGGRVYADFSFAGVITCASRLQPIQGPLAINGDINGDGIADLLINGLFNAGAAGARMPAQAGERLAVGLEIAASDVTVRGLSLRGFIESAISVLGPPGGVLANIAVLNSQIVDSEGDGITVSAATRPGQPTRLRNVLIGNNRIGDTATGIAVEPNGTERASLETVTIVGNRVAASAPNGRAGIAVGPRDAQDTVFTQINVIGNQIDAAESDNGIELFGGEGSSANTVMDVKVRGNTVSNARFAGIFVEGGTGAGSNVVMAELRENTATDGDFAGVLLESGASGAEDNLVEGKVEDNTVSNNPAGVVLSAGFQDAANNLLMSDVMGNDVQNSPNAGINVIGGWSAAGNTLDGVIEDNAVTDSGIGIFVCSGTTTARQDNQGAAADNQVVTRIAENTVQNSADTGIVVVGGFDDSRGAVIRNAVEGDIIANQSDGIRCADNIEGNPATCTIEGNTDTGQQPTSSPAAKAAFSAVEAVQSPANERLAAHRDDLAEKTRQLRERAAATDDPQERDNLLRLGDRLQALEDKLGASANRR